MTMGVVQMKQLFGQRLRAQTVVTVRWHAAGCSENIQHGRIYVETTFLSAVTVKLGAGCATSHPASTPSSSPASQQQLQKT
jgi:hypothetical protein